MQGHQLNNQVEEVDLTNVVQSQDSIISPQSRLPLSLNKAMKDFIRALSKLGPVYVGTSCSSRLPYSEWD